MVKFGTSIGAWISRPVSPKRLLTWVRKDLDKAWTVLEMFNTFSKCIKIFVMRSSEGRYGKSFRYVIIWLSDLTGAACIECKTEVAWYARAEAPAVKAYFLTRPESLIVEAESAQIIFLRRDRLEFGNPFLKKVTSLALENKLRQRRDMSWRRSWCKYRSTSALFTWRSRHSALCVASRPWWSRWWGSRWWAAKWQEGSEDCGCWLEDVVVTCPCRTHEEE